MQILAWIVIGLVVGWLTGILFKGKIFWANLLLGVIGAVVAGFVFGGSIWAFFDPSKNLNLLPLALPVLGAVLPVAALHVIRHRQLAQSANISHEPEAQR